VSLAQKSTKCKKNEIKQKKQQGIKGKKPECKLNANKVDFPFLRA